jgi:hypothetical protein
VVVLHSTHLFSVISQTTDLIHGSCLSCHFGDVCVQSVDVLHASFRQSRQLLNINQVSALDFKQCLLFWLSSGLVVLKSLDVFGKIQNVIISVFQVLCSCQRDPGHLVSFIVGMAKKSYPRLPLMASLAILCQAHLAT